MLNTVFDTEEQAKVSLDREQNSDENVYDQSSDGTGAITPAEIRVRIYLTI